MAEALGQDGEAEELVEAGTGVALDGLPGRVNCLIEGKVTAFVPWEGNPRKRFDEDSLAALAAEIKAAGGVEQPIHVRFRPGANPDGRQRFQIICGERRWRASQLAGFAKIRAIYIGTISDEEALDRAVRENQTRKNLSPIEEARAYVRMLEARPGLTQQELATQKGISQGTLSNALRLLRLPGHLVERIDRGLMSRAVGVAICGMLGEEPAEFAKLVSLVDEHGWSSGQIEGYVRRFKEDREEASRRAEAADEAAFDADAGAEVEVIPPGPDGEAAPFGTSDSAGEAHWAGLPPMTASATPTVVPEASRVQEPVLPLAETMPESPVTVRDRRASTAAPAASVSARAAPVAPVAPATAKAAPVAALAAAPVVVREMPAPRDGFRWVEVRADLDDRLFEETDADVNGALDGFLKSLAEPVSGSEWELTPLGRKLGKALRDDLQAKDPSMPALTVPESVERVLSICAMQRGIDVALIKELPE